MKVAKKKFYGATSVGEKGQVVIPIEARTDLKLEKGNKLLVFGLGDILVLGQLHDIEKIATELSKRLSVINKIIDKEQ